ncbi:unnamed protein product [Symbiodinium necroappetens]|uniref:CENP-V/GFA domain-containing protein n=1 Tax=Symbiodinium necroappetens TaxID=1628268 RepID=A0A812RW25_9DINO|nr:unnamed protein product [Symbiodinium necroappetens]
MHLEGSCHCGAVAFSLESATPVPFQRCYCSICRKTQGGGGFAINLGGAADSLAVAGGAAIGTYRAHDPEGAPGTISEGERSFCTRCGAGLWVWDPRWPELIHPFASAIDTPLPAAPEHVDLMLAYKPDWVVVPEGPSSRFQIYPEESLEAWHRRHGLLDHKAK